MSLKQHKGLIIIVTLLVRYWLLLKVESSFKITFLTFIIPVFYGIYFLVSHISKKSRFQPRNESDNGSLHERDRRIKNAYKDLVVMTLVIGLGMNFYDGWPIMNMGTISVLSNFVMGSLCWSLLSLIRTASDIN